MQRKLSHALDAGKTLLFGDRHYLVVPDETGHRVVDAQSNVEDVNGLILH